MPQTSNARPLDERVALIERRRAEFLDAVADLGVAARQRLSLAERIRRQPWPWLAGGLVAGWWLGGRAARKSLARRLR